MNWNEILKKYTVETLEFIKSGKDVALSQGQLYIQELLKWEICSKSFIAIISLMVIIVCIWAIVSAVRLEDKYENIDRRMVSFILGGFFFALGFVIFTDSSLSALKAYIAPRVVVIDKLQKVISGKGN